MLPSKIKRISVKLGLDQSNHSRAHEDLPTTLRLEGEYAYAALLFFGYGTRFAEPELRAWARVKIDELDGLGLIKAKATCSRWFVLDTEVELHSSDGDAA